LGSSLLGSARHASIAIDRIRIAEVRYWRTFIPPASLGRFWIYGKFADALTDPDSYRDVAKPKVIPLRRESAPVHLILRLNILGVLEIRDEGSGAA
jgi:hypothetical protein